MPDQLQLRGGTTTEHNSFTGALREVTVDTTKKTLVVHDGSQAGGTPLMKESGTVDPANISIGTGGVQRLAISSSEVVFNETSTDTDFRIEGNGNANLFKLDAGNDRIGIGTGSPQNMLNVHGVYETNAFDSANGQGGRFTAKGFLIGDAYSAGKTTSDDRNTILWNERGLNIDFATDDTLRMTIKSDGNVGIGVSNPQHLLHLQNSSVSTTKVTVESTGTNSYPAFRLINDARSYDLGINGANDAFRIYDVTGTSERFTLLSGGNVGLGITNPAEKLDVNGSIQFSNYAKATGDMLLCADIDNNNSGTAIRFLIDGAANSDEIMRITSDGRVGINQDNPGAELEVHHSTDPEIHLNINTHGDVGQIKGDSDGLTLTGNGSSDQIRFKTGGVERARFDGTSGRLLIGTTTNTFTGVGSSKLQISGTGADTAGINCIRTSNDAGGAFLQFTKNRGSATQSGDTVGAISWMGHDGTDVESYFAMINVKANQGSNNNQLYGRLMFHTTDGSSIPSERMRIMPNGNVGIGCTNPGQKLEIRQTAASHAVMAVNRPNSDTFAIALGNNSSNNGILSVNNTDLLFGRDDSGTFTERMRIMNNGNVGIGTSSPNTELQVDGGTPEIRLQCTDGGLGSGQEIGRLSIHTIDTTVGGGNGAGEVFHIKSASSTTNGSDYTTTFEHRAGSGGGGIKMSFGNAVGSIQMRTGSGVLRYVINAIGDFFYTNADSHASASQAGISGQESNSYEIKSSTGSQTSEGTRMRFFNANGQIGRIFTSGSSTTYSTSSDYRLKENDVAISDGITRLKQLRPIRFNFKADPTLTLDGFFAHEAQQVVPEAVSGTKDEVAKQSDVDSGAYENVGDLKPQDIDHSKLVPLLVAAVKELITKVETLEAA